MAELLAIRDTGDLGAVGAYERQYGIVPEATFPHVAPAGEGEIEPATAEEFELLWTQGRAALEAVEPGDWPIR